MRRATLLFSGAITAGCSSVGGLGGTPIEAVPVAPDAPATWEAAGVDGQARQGDWLAQFNDSTMTRLVQEALTANPDLRAQIAARDAAVEDLRAQAGTRRPQVSGTASAGATRTTFEGPGGGAISDEAATYGLAANASWELDLWGRLKAGVAEAGAQLEAAQADLRAARLSIAAQTAIGWINLNAAIAQEQVARETLAARQSTQELTERRFARGLSTALDVRLARSAAAGSEVNLSVRERQTVEAARSLEVLLGRYPSAEVNAPATLPELDAIEPAGNPVMMLSRRPDIAAAEARVEAAGLRAEQARLALYPSLSLSGQISADGETIDQVFDPSFIAGRLIANLTQTLYSGGRLRAQRDGLIARIRVAVANYAGAALNAWREVEDAIAADGYLAAQERAQMRALEEAGFAEELAERQYRNGLVSIFNFIDAQTRRLDAEAALVRIRSERAVNRIRYNLALGGGVPDSARVSGPDEAGATGGSS